MPPNRSMSPRAGRRHSSTEVQIKHGVLTWGGSIRLDRQNTQLMTRLLTSGNQCLEVLSKRPIVTELLMVQLLRIIQGRGQILILLRWRQCVRGECNACATRWSLSASGASVCMGSGPAEALGIPLCGSPVVTVTAKPGIPLCGSLVTSL
jgi:hypothetical protein